MNRKKPTLTKKKSGLYSGSSYTITKNITISIVVPYTDDRLDGLKLLAESISKIKNDTKSNYEIVLTGYGSHANSDQYIDNEPVFINLKGTNTLITTKPPENSTFLQALIHGLSVAQKDYILFIELQGVTNSFSLNNGLTLRDDKISNDKVFQLVKGDVERLKVKLDNFILFPRPMADYLFSNLYFKSDWRHELIFRLKKLKIETENLGVIQLKDETPDFLPVFYKRLVYNMCLGIYWFFVLPLKEFKTKPHREHAFLKEPALYRFGFSVLALLLFVILPLMSLKSGISGDEYKFQYPQAKKLYNFYVSLGKDMSYSETAGRFDTYGMVFDTFTVFVIEIFDIKNYYEARHILNSLMGWLAILAVGLIARYLAGWRAGIIAMLLLFLSPRFLGHSWNNPKDIPFATFYILSILHIIKYLLEFPNPKRGTIFILSLCIGLAISNRVGGLLLIPYVFLFSGLYFLFTSKRGSLFSNDNVQKFWRLMGFSLLISVMGYILCVPFWPYAIQNPIKNPLSALKFLSNYVTGLRQLFEGKIIWSNNIPWYYVPKYMLITIPAVVFTGIIGYLMLLPMVKYRLKYFWAFLLLFVCIFPIYYIIHKKSNIYGGWRHVIFAYPSIVVIAALGFDTFFTVFKNKIARFVFLLLFLFLSFFPLKYIIVNHPYQYVYFNELIGGMKNAYGKYELDYYFHSEKEAIEWLLDHIHKEGKKGQGAVKISSNFVDPLPYYIRDAKDSIILSYCRYYERGNYDWDYAIVINTYINQYQLKKKIWPPRNTLYTIDVDGYPICAIIKRVSKDDYYGYQALQKNNLPEGITYLERAIKADPANEIALLNLGQVMLNLRNYSKAIEYSNMCLKVYPNYDRALNLLGVAYMNMGDLQNALAAFNQITKVNYKYYTAYYNMAIIYARLNNIDAAIQNVQKTLQFNSQYKPAYYFMADLLRSKGMNAEADRYIQAGNSIK